VGMPCEEFHVAVTGQIKLYALSPAGQEKVIELAGPGISFAEALMFTERPYIVSAQALTDSLVLSVGKAAVVREIESEPRIGMRMLAGSAGPLQGLMHGVKAYSLYSGTQRVIGYLLNALHEEAPAHCCAAATPAPTAPAIPRSVSLPVSKATIASRLSIT